MTPREEREVRKLLKTATLHVKGAQLGDVRIIPARELTAEKEQHLIDYSLKRASGKKIEPMFTSREIMKIMRALGSPIHYRNLVRNELRKVIRERKKKYGLL